MGYEVEQKKARILIRKPLPKKSKIKENDVNDEDYVVPLPIFTTESQPTVTCSTSYDWSATPLASLDHSYCMSEENMSLPSSSDLTDEIKTLKIEHYILKDKVKTSKQPIKILVQRHNKFIWKKITIDAKNEVLYWNCIRSLIQYSFYINQTIYIQHITYWKGPKHAMRILKRTRKKKNGNIIKPP